MAILLANLGTGVRSGGGLCVLIPKKFRNKSRLKDPTSDFMYIGEAETKLLKLATRNLARLADVFGLA